METALSKPRFHTFGGKRRVASLVWRALGDPEHYIEPFFGSGAVLLLRPEAAGGIRMKKRLETVCDLDSFLCNVWRSLQFSPDEVARWCDWPVNHVDLASRRRCLASSSRDLQEALIADDMFCDPKLAGYWIWCASCWIGRNMLKYTDSGIGSMPRVNGVSGVRPPGGSKSASPGGKRVCQVPGVVPGPVPHISRSGDGVCSSYAQDLKSWFAELSDRLRFVRVVCGDWTKVCGGQWQDDAGICGMFMDPPYGVTDRTDVYLNDGAHIAPQVLEWCRDRGTRSSYRIVIAGYEEYAPLVDHHGWRSLHWKTSGGYGNTRRRRAPLDDDCSSLDISKEMSRGQSNARRETLYFSPHCLPLDEAMKTGSGLF